MFKLEPIVSEPTFPLDIYLQLILLHQLPLRITFSIFLTPRRTMLFNICVWKFLSYKFHLIGLMIVPLYLS